MSDLSFRQAMYWACRNEWFAR